LSNEKTRFAKILIVKNHFPERDGNRADCRSTARKLANRKSIGPEKRKRYDMLPAEKSNGEKSMGRGPRKPKFYLRKSFNYKEWFCICQTSNNVMVCECPNERIAVLILDYLNGLSYNQTGRIKTK
jgi:hypothetical protein